jgi:hypothetical protein
VTPSCAEIVAPAATAIGVGPAERGLAGVGLQRAFEGDALGREPREQRVIEGAIVEREPAGSERGGREERDDRRDDRHPGAHPSTSQGGHRCVVRVHEPLVLEPRRTARLPARGEPRGREQRPRDAQYHPRLDPRRKPRTVQQAQRERRRRTGQHPRLHPPASDRDLVSDLFQGGRTDPAHVLEVIDRCERTVLLPVFDDRGREHLPDAGQGLELRRGR